jgi:hypothetical protein
MHPRAYAGRTATTRAASEEAEPGRVERERLDQMVRVAGLAPKAGRPPGRLASGLAAWAGQVLRVVAASLTMAAVELPA